MKAIVFLIALNSTLLNPVSKVRRAMLASPKKFGVSPPARLSNL